MCLIDSVCGDHKGISVCSTHKGTVQGLCAEHLNICGWPMCKVSAEGLRVVLVFCFFGFSQCFLDFEVVRSLVSLFSVSPIVLSSRLPAVLPLFLLSLFSRSPVLSVSVLSFREFEKK